MKVHVRKDGSEYVIRFWHGKQWYDDGLHASHMGAARHLIEKAGGYIDTRPDIVGWDELLMPELIARLQARLT
jgi:hypothetical protein